MPSLYQQCLEAAIDYLTDLKAHGVRHVPVGASTRDGLFAPLGRAPTRQAAPLANPAAVPSREPHVPAVAALAESSDTSMPSPRSRTDSPSPSSSSGSLSRAQPSLSLGTSGSPPLSREAKEQAMSDLRRRALACAKCEHLVRTRTQVVFGVGSAHAELMFVGEAPGADEDREGEPFVGRAGQLLTRIIQTMGLSRETVYIANILKCRPDTPGQSSGNRKPTPSEMAACIPYLLDQIRIIQPKVLVALGATAMDGLMGKMEGITRVRGHWLEYAGIPLMPTYHPAYLLHNQALSEKRKVWEDMLQVMERLGLPISNKQRGYFLRSS